MPVQSVRTPTEFHPFRRLAAYGVQLELGDDNNYDEHDSMRKYKSQTTAYFHMKDDT
jgi:hypothetical protein